MSLIAFADGILVADSVAEDLYAGVSFKSTLQKIHVSPSKCFAWAYCGNRIHTRQLKAFHDAFAVAMARVEVHRLDAPFFVEDDAVSLLSENTFIVINRDRAWCRTSDAGNDPRFTELDLNHEIVAFGTISPAFRVAHVGGGLSPVLAATEACSFCYGFSDEECGINSIKQADLHPFPKPEEIAAKVEKVKAVATARRKK